MKSTLTSLLALTAVVSLVGAKPASAAIMSTIDTDIAPDGGAIHAPYTPPNPPFNPSSTDLLTGIAPTLVNPNASDYTREESAGPSVLTNGSVSTVYGQGGPAGDAIDHAAYMTAGENELVIWNLGGTYNLTEAVVYGGWNDGGRDQTFFGLDVSTDGGATFTNLIAPVANASGTTPISHRIRILDDASPYFATGVTHVRLDPGGVENGWTGYTEVDVFGVQIPEPSTLTLVGLLGLAAVALRRHR